MTPGLSSYQWHTDISPLADTLTTAPDYLIIQDLDGVCMGLVNDPLSRTMDPGYVHAVRNQEGRFYVLTNGEHIGKRGVNPMIDRALGNGVAKTEGLYLPGLGAGGVQLQNRFGKVSHPGVSSQEMAFLLQIPVKARYFLINLLGNSPYNLAKENIQLLAEAVVLDNRASPTINANLLSAVLGSVTTVRQLQQDLQRFMTRLLQDAQSQGMGESFFIHYAPNLGTDPATGLERIKPADDSSWGTTDFQFMLKGAVKESGVLVLLNQYFAAKTGAYPLGADFSVRTAPASHNALLELAQSAFDPALMPRIIGVGDTITSHQIDGEWQRGGSDRGFLTLVQDLGQAFDSDNVVVLIDSSGDEVIRPAVDTGALQRYCATDPQYWQAVAGLSDANDPLRVNFVLAGHSEYRAFFVSALG